MSRAQLLLTRTRRAFNVVQLLIVLVILFVAVVLLLPALARPRINRRDVRDGTQIRNVVQSMAIFANGNRDRYPLPSLLDADNQTIAETGRAKDTTNNVLSILVFSCFISPELLYSPSEADDRIKIHAGYQTANPSAAVNPQKALWDPSLRADFTTGDGHISYATQMTSGDADKMNGRLAWWMNTFNATEAVLGNRGPLVTGLDAKGNILHDTTSKTMLIHGGRTTWEGNIAYNDNHVNFETRMDPEEITYRVVGSKSRPDIFFYDEPDAADGLNAYLGIWVKAGIFPSEFTGIHD